MSLFNMFVANSIQYGIYLECDEIKVELGKCRVVILHYFFITHRHFVLTAIFQLNLSLLVASLICCPHSLQTYASSCDEQKLFICFSTLSDHFFLRHPLCLILSTSVIVQV